MSAVVFLYAVVSLFLFAFLFVFLFALAFLFAFVFLFVRSCSCSRSCSPLCRIASAAARHVSITAQHRNVLCPASATLMEIPTRRLIQQKNLFSVDDCALKWHPGKSGAVSVYHAPVLIAHVSR